MNRYSREAGEMAGTHGMNLFVFSSNSVNNSFISGAVSNCFYSFSLYIQTIDTYISGGKKKREKKRKKESKYIWHA